LGAFLKGTLLLPASDSFRSDANGRFGSNSVVEYLEAFRVLKTGGRLAFTVWDVPQETKLFGAVMEAVQTHGSLDVGLPAGPNMFMFSDPTVCEKALSQAGFKECVVTKVSQIWRPTSGEQILEAVKTGTVRTRGTLARQPRPTNGACSV
jgi:hypothetical protein